MRKSTRIVKRVFALLLVVLMSIESLGAVVSDNDGSAFITKAEFDSLKNNFQAQIEQYNTSIDSKIDGAIASYLAGINLRKKTAVRPICYYDDYIYSVVNDDGLIWNEGYLSWEGWSFLIRTNKETWAGTNYNGMLYAALISRDWNDSAFKSFKEASIRNVNTTNWTAQWNGYCETKYKFNMNDAQNFETRWGPGYVTNKGAWWHLCSFYPDSSTQANYHEWDKATASFSNWGINYAENNGTTGVNGWNPQKSMINPSRRIFKTTKQHLIQTSKDNQMKGFVNYDGFYDFHNDTDSTYTHTPWTTGCSNVIKVSYAYFALNKIAHDSTAAIPMTFLRTSNTTSSTYELPLSCGFSSVLYNPGDANTIVLPYVGFSRNYINQWDQIWTSDYDNYIEEMEETDPSLNVLKDSDNKKHLALSAGLPIYLLENESKLELDLEFNDATDHYVWIKQNSFSATVDPQDDPNLITDFEYTKNGSFDDTSKAILVPANTKVTIKTNELDKKGFVYIKWSLTTNSYKGGGEFKTPSTILLETSGR